MATRSRDAPSTNAPTELELRSARRLLLVAGCVYLMWWLVVEGVLPGSVNPGLGRVVVSAAFFVSLAASFVSQAARRHIVILFEVSSWLLTAHYYYLLHCNHGDMPWATGAYVVLIGVGACLTSRSSLLAYSVATLLLAVAVSLVDRALLHSIFLPGLVTMMLLSNYTLHSRLLLERERAEHARASAARALAEEGIALRDEFIAIASHEFRTPLASLQLTVQGLARNLHRPEGPPSAEKLEHSVDLCVRQTARLARLVEELLDASQVTGGTLALRMEKVLLLDVARDVAQSLAGEAARSGSRLEVEGDPKVAGQWDRTRMEQVVSNLLRNALTFGRGQPIHISVGAKGDVARLSVADHGTGIPREDQSRIFGRFERAASAEHYGGMGLGLYVVSRIVDAHGGHVHVESEPGNGATFIVDLPRTAG